MLAFAKDIAVTEDIRARLLAALEKPGDCVLVLPGGPRIVVVGSRDGGSNALYGKPVDCVVAVSTSQMDYISTAQRHDWSEAFCGEEKRVYG